jgi:hypothetical protein
MALLVLSRAAGASGKPDPTGPPPDLTRGGKLEWTDFSYHLGPTGAHGQMFVRKFMTDEVRQIPIT